MQNWCKSFWSFLLFWCKINGILLIYGFSKRQHWHYHFLSHVPLWRYKRHKRHIRHMNIFLLCGKGKSFMAQTSHPSHLQKSLHFEHLAIRVIICRLLIQEGLWTYELYLFVPDFIPVNVGCFEFKINIKCRPCEI